VPPAERGAHLLQVEGMLGDQDHVRATGQTRVQRDPSGAPAHHLDEHDAVVALGRAVKAIDRVGRHLHGGAEADRVVGARDIVVDRLRDADDLHALLGELGGRPERSLAADRHEPVHLKIVQRGSDALGSFGLTHGVDAGAAQDRPAAMQDAADRVAVELDGLTLHDPEPAVAEPDTFVTEDADRLADDAADRGVEAGAIAPAGEDADPRHRTS
jgi:hypothetical protein